MKVYVESKNDIIERKADGRGRVTLGTDFAGKDVQLAILDTSDGGEE
jgi:hypothetical protein